MIKNMFNNKYSKTLTIILIIVIIVIIGLLIFFGIDVYRKYYIEQASGDAVREFEDKINEIASVPQGNTVLTNELPNVDLNSIYGNQGTQQNDITGSGVKYMGYDMIGTIEIPATDVKYPIIADYETSINSLNVAIVKLYPSTIALNEIGNTVLVGHNYRNGTFFSNNKKLEKGDKIYITDLSGRKVTYAVTKKYETSTSDSEYMNRDTNGKREISLSTCTDDTKRRLIIWAEEVE